MLGRGGRQHFLKFVIAVDQALYRLPGVGRGVVGDVADGIQVRQGVGDFFGACRAGAGVGLAADDGVNVLLEAQLLEFACGVLDTGGVGASGYLFGGPFQLVV